MSTGNFPHRSWNYHVKQNNIVKYRAFFSRSGWKKHSEIAEERRKQSWWGESKEPRIWVDRIKIFTWTELRKMPMVSQWTAFSACGARYFKTWDLSFKTRFDLRSVKFSPNPLRSVNLRDTPHPYPPHWISGYMFQWRNFTDLSPMVCLRLSSSRSLK